MDGQPILTTIDSTLQESAALAVKDAVVKHKATNGVAIVMDPKTGEIRARAQLVFQNPFDALNPRFTIRRALAGGAVETATRLLGRPFEARGLVVQGDQRGRLLGFPTANVEVPRQLCLPADGVYAGTFIDAHGTEHVAAISLGRRPTFYDDRGLRLLEPYLLDFDGDLYDQTVEVRFHHNPDADATAPGLTALSRALQLADFTVNALGVTAVADDRDVKDPAPILQAFGLGEKCEKILKSFDQEMEAIRGIL